MKIALIHYRLILRGGLERRLFNYTNYLLEQGHEVEVIVAKRSHDAQLPEAVKVHVLSPGLMPKVFRQRYFDHLLGKFMQQQNYDLSLSLMRTSHQDLVLCPGNHLGFFKAMHKKGNRLTDKEQIRCDKAAFRQSRKIIAASEMMAKELRELYHIPQDKIHVLRPPVNLAHFKPGNKVHRDAYRKKYNLPLDKRIFLFISSSHFRKGLPLLLDCFRQLQDTDAVLVIAGLPPVQSELPNVIDLQYNTQIDELYAAADFTIHPARYEPFGQIVPESLSSGTPVIISDTCGAVEVVGPDEGRILPATATADWLHTIRNIQTSDFNIPENYAELHSLSVAEHVEAILAIGKTTY